MAMRILASRLVHQAQGSLQMRVCSASMSSSSSTPASQSPKAPTTSVSSKPRRESLRSKLASIFGGYVDPADPNEPPLPASKVNFPDVTEHATGEEKLFLLAFENGIIDPYFNLPIERGNRGTKDDPVVVESFEDSRIVACVCEEAQTYVKYMTVWKGESKRCPCGYWVKCVDAPKLWEKIPREDLIEIPWYRELHEEGLLDEYLRTGKLPEGNHGSIN